MIAEGVQPTNPVIEGIGQVSDGPVTTGPDQIPQLEVQERRILRDQREVVKHKLMAQIRRLQIDMPTKSKHGKAKTNPTKRTKTKYRKR